MSPAASIQPVEPLVARGPKAVLLVQAQVGEAMPRIGDCRVFNQARGVAAGAGIHLVEPATRGYPQAMRAGGFVRQDAVDLRRLP